MNNFLIFVAPFIIVVFSIMIAFLIAPRDKIVNKE